MKTVPLLAVALTVAAVLMLGQAPPNEGHAAQVSFPCCEDMQPLFSHAFRETIEFSQPNELLFTVAPDKTRYITGMHWLDPWSNSRVFDIRVDSELLLRLQGHPYAGPAAWTSGGGAPIVIEPGQTVTGEFPESSHLPTVTITDYEYP